MTDKQQPPQYVIVVQKEKRIQNTHTFVTLRWCIKVCIKLKYIYIVDGERRWLYIMKNKQQINLQRKTHTREREQEKINCICSIYIYLYILCVYNAKIEKLTFVETLDKGSTYIHT